MEGRTKEISEDAWREEGKKQVRMEERREVTCNGERKKEGNMWGMEGKRMK